MYRNQATVGTQKTPQINKATPKTFPIILHVYDYEKSHLKKFFGHKIGVFRFRRISIEVEGQEYQFLDYIDTDGRETQGLLVGNPNRYTITNKGLRLVESLVIGRVSLNKEEINQGICQIYKSYTSYNYVRHNSHHFISEVLDFLRCGFVWEHEWGDGLKNIVWAGDTFGKGGDSEWKDRNQQRFPMTEKGDRALMVTAVTTLDDAKKATYAVILHVYEVPSSITRRFLGFKRKCFRSSIEVHGVEYMFCEHDGVAGIMMTTPRRISHMKGLEFAKSIMMGRTDAEMIEVRERVEGVGRAGGYGAYPRNVYDYISKNCHHFSDDLCKALVGKGIPGWIKRSAFYERNYTGEALTTREKRGRLFPQVWMDGSLFVERNPPRDCWPVRMLNYLNANDAHTELT